MQSKRPNGLTKTLLTISGTLLLAGVGFMCRDVYSRISILEQETDRRAWLIQTNNQRSRTNEARLIRIEDKIDRILDKIDGTAER